jgi:hypothetical protein
MSFVPAYIAPNRISSDLYYKGGADQKKDLKKNKLKRETL